MNTKFLLVGLGGMGQHHARNLNELKLLSAISDVKVDLCIEKSKKFNVPFSTNYQKLVDDYPFDAAIVATPTPTHFSIAKYLLEKGLNILLEKPITQTEEEAQELIDIAKSNNKILAIGYIEKYNPAFQGLLTLIKENYFGEITSINIKRVGGIPRSADNVIFDLMTHDICLLNSIFSKLPNKYYIHKKYNKTKSIIDSAQALLSYGDASATCETNWISPIKIRKIEITGIEGYVEVNLINQQITKFETNKPINIQKNFNSFLSYKEYVSQFGEPCIQSSVKFNQEPLKEEIKAFVNAIQTQTTQKIVSGKEALDILCITKNLAYGED